MGQRVGKLAAKPDVRLSMLAAAWRKESQVPQAVP